MTTCSGCTPANCTCTTAPTFASERAKGYDPSRHIDVSSAPISMAEATKFTAGFPKITQDADPLPIGMIEVPTNKDDPGYKCPECGARMGSVHLPGCSRPTIKDKGHPNPLDVQVGGEHYKKLRIQPMEYSMANGLDACQHTVVKYVTRFRDKGGIADLEKAKHTIDLLIELEKRYG